LESRLNTEGLKSSCFLTSWAVFSPSVDNYQAKAVWEHCGASC